MRPPSSPTRSCNCGRTTRSARLFNMVGFQTKLKYGEQARDLPDDPGPRARRIRPARRHPPQHLLNSPRLLDGRLRLKAAAAAALRRPDHRLRGLCRERGGRPGRRPPRRRRAARPAARAAAADDRDRRAPQPYHRRAYRIDRRRTPLLPADERQFRPVSADRRAARRRGGARLPGPERGAARKRALSARAERDLAGWINAAGELEAVRSRRLATADAERLS